MGLLFQEIQDRFGAVRLVLLQQRPVGVHIKGFLFDHAAEHEGNQDRSDQMDKAELSWRSLLAETSEEEDGWTSVEEDMRAKGTEKERSHRRWKHFSK